VVVEPRGIELPLTGPEFDRALALAQEAVTAFILHGESGAHSALNPILTEAANDAVVGGLLDVALTSLAANMAVWAATLEAERDGGEASEAEIGDHAANLVRESLAQIAEAVRHTGP
jgi:hypothetical protein